MKKHLFVSFLIAFILVTLTSALPATGDASDYNYTSAYVAVFLDGKQLNLDQEPVLFKNRMLVPLRSIAESLGASVHWGSSQVTVRKGDAEIRLIMDSDKCLTGRQIFFLEQPPVIVNGRTMVSLRFVREALGVNVAFDEKNGRVYISAGDGMLSNRMDTQGDEKQGGDNYYKLYGLVIGEADIGPVPEEAKAYVLREGQLKAVKDVQITPISFGTPYNPYNTMVVGNDEAGREKAVWLVLNTYTGYISVTGSIYMDDLAPEESIYSKLEEKGINRTSIKKIHIAPYQKNKIYWFVTAEQNNKSYHYFFDCRTGEIVI